MKKLLSLVMIASSLFLTAAENLLANGNFAQWTQKLPDGWFSADSWTYAGEKGIFKEAGAAPGGLNAATVKNGDHLLRQGSLKLVAGKKYELSVQVKASGKKYGKCRIGIINKGWIKCIEISEKDFIKDGQWHKLTKKFTLMESKGDWGFVAGFNVKDGTLSYADICLTAEDPEVEKQCFNACTVPTRDMIPYSPYLCEIPEEKPVLKMLLNVKGKGPFFCIYQADKNKAGKAAFRNGFAELDLSGLKPGKYTLFAKLADGSGRILSQDSFSMEIRRKVEVKTDGIRRLNNLVLSLAEEQVSGNGGIVFGNPREGWVYFSLPAGSNVSLDGKAVRYPEFVRYLAKGNHVLKLTDANGKAVVRAIPEIFSYPFNRVNYIEGAGKYDWEFTKKYFLPASTTFSGGKFLPEDAEEFKERGLDFLVNLTAKLRQKAESGKQQEILDRIQHKAFELSHASGCSMDEFFWNRPCELLAFAKLVNKIAYPEGKRVYTWIAGDINSRSPALTDVLSILLNITGSRGMALYEAYCVQQKTQAEAEKYLSFMLNEHTSMVLSAYPDALSKFGVIMGNFNQLPIISIESYPYCDYKYFLDMQCCILANHPVYKDLGCIGYWGTYYGDEEMARWSFRLLRHYAIEGHKEMLSPKFGFTYNVNYLKNSDFEDGLKEWTCSKNGVKAEKIDDLGSYERRWGKPGADCGAYCVVLKNQKRNTPSIRQTAKGLIPGKLYSLKFCTALYNTVKKKDLKAGLKDDGIDVEIKNVTMLPEKQYDGGKENPKFPAMMIHRRVFKANGSEAEIIFTNTKPEASSVMNFVQLVPYYQE